MSDAKQGPSGIRIITEPTVYVLARQATAEGIGEFLRDIGSHWQSTSGVPADKVVEFAGRCCYMSFDKPRPGGNAAYIGHILEVGHGSVLEHASWTLLITGVSRSLTHELVRHRVGMSYSHLSQRFVDSSAAAFVVPPALLGEHAHGALRSMPGSADEWADSMAFSDWRKACGLALALYRSILGQLRDDMPDARRKQIMEAARSVLPNCTETKIVVSGNARASRHFLHLRGSEAADAEIRRLACVVARTLKAESPNLFADVSISEVGTVEVQHGSV